MVKLFKKRLLSDTFSRNQSESDIVILQRQNQKIAPSYGLMPDVSSKNLNEIKKNLMKNFGLTESQAKKRMKDSGWEDD